MHCAALLLRMATHARMEALMETRWKQTEPPMPDSGLRKVLPIALVAAIFAAGLTFYATHNGVISTERFEPPAAAPSSPPAAK
jgi:hypothetical protein